VLANGRQKASASAGSECAKAEERLRFRTISYIMSTRNINYTRALGQIGPLVVPANILKRIR